MTFATTSYAFHPHDRVTINGRPYRPISRSDSGYVFEREDGTAVAEHFTKHEVHALVAGGKVKQEPGYFLAEEARRRGSITVRSSASLTDVQKNDLDFKLSYVLAFLGLEAQGVAKRTDQSINTHFPAISRDAERLLSQKQREAKRRYAGRKVEQREAPSERSLRRWVTLYQTKGIYGLLDGRERSGNRIPRLDPEVQRILSASVEEYADPQRPSKEAIYQALVSQFRRINEKRKESGLTPLSCPSRETTRRQIDSLDPYHTALRRFGQSVARKKFAPVGATRLNLTRPLQRVEMDAWKIDLMTLFTEQELIESFGEGSELVAELRASSGRWWLYVAICAVTRCIIGMKLSVSPTAEDAVSCLDMCLQPKRAWLDATGAQTEWPVHGMPELLVTDGGSDFTSARFIGALQNLGLTAERAVGGLPHLRGTIERFFGTAANRLLPFLTGRTFASVKERDETDTVINAALSLEDLSFALIRWVVDVYHNTPHAGLDGETPLNAWLRLSEIYGVQPPPDLRTRRIIFGTQLERRIMRTGVEVLGVQYHCDALASHFLRNPRAMMQIRWLADNIGAVEVEIQGEWHTAQASRAMFEDLSADVWKSAVHDIRSRQRAGSAIASQAVDAAIDAIKSRNTAAMKRANLARPEWRATRIESEERRLFVGFQIATPEEWIGPENSDGLGRSVPALSESDLPHETSSDATQLHVTRRQKPKPKSMLDGDNKWQL